MLSLSAIKRHLHLHWNGDHNLEHYSASVPIWMTTKSNAQPASSLVLWLTHQYEHWRHSWTITSPLPIRLWDSLHAGNILQPLQQKVWPCLGKTLWGKIEGPLWEFSHPCWGPAKLQPKAKNTEMLLLTKHVSPVKERFLTAEGPRGRENSL